MFAVGIAGEIFAHLVHPRFANISVTTTPAVSQGKILNADVSRFTRMHADGDTHLMIRLIAYGPCPVNHTDPSALLTWQITAARGYFRFLAVWDG
jgi:hypothetical protein